MNKQKEENKKIFNRHFIGMMSIFVLVIVTVLTFVSFVEDALKNDKTLREQSKQQQGK